MQGYKGIVHEWNVAHSCVLLSPHSVKKINTEPTFRNERILHKNSKFGFSVKIERATNRLACFPT